MVVVVLARIADIGVSFRHPSQPMHDAFRIIRFLLSKATIEIPVSPDISSLSMSQTISNLHVNPKESQKLQ